MVTRNSSSVFSPFGSVPAVRLRSSTAHQRSDKRHVMARRDVHLADIEDPGILRPRKSVRRAIAPTMLPRGELPLELADSLPAGEAGGAKARHGADSGGRLSGLFAYRTPPPGPGVPRKGSLPPFEGLAEGRHRVEEVFVRLGHPDLVDQELHRLDRIELGEGLPEEPQPLELVALDEEFLFP